jgi:hypothetical protein
VNRATSIIVSGPIGAALPVVFTAPGAVWDQARHRVTYAAAGVYVGTVTLATSQLAYTLTLTQTAR